jgi:hypothetical protein
VGDLLYGRVDCPSEIAYLEYIETVEYVFRFYVAVDHGVAVQVARSVGDLAEVERAERLVEVILVADLFEETAVGGQFKQQVDLGAFLEEAVHFEDVGVGGVELDLDLLRHLALHPCVLHLLLVHHLYRQDQSAPDLAGHVHVSESATAQLPAHFEHAEIEFLLLTWCQQTAEIEQRLLCDLTVEMMRFGDEQFSVDVLVLLQVVPFVLFLRSIFGIALSRGVDGRLVESLPDRLLLETLHGHCSHDLLVVQCGNCLWFLGVHALGGVGVELREGVSEGLETLVGVAVLTAEFLVALGIAIEVVGLDRVDHGIG